jgi:hypothetical protein
MIGFYDLKLKIQRVNGGGNAATKFTEKKVQEFRVRRSRLKKNNQPAHIKRM